MAATATIKLNFKGGIISPGDLYNIAVAAGKSGVWYFRFGLRQQLLFDVPAEEINNISAELNLLRCAFEINKDEFPNIVSSYPAEEIFITNTWLSEGVYKDIFDLVDYQPRLKINVSDSNQSFTPMLTGNINWVASPVAQHFWHLFIRFPKTNVICEWRDIVYTNDVARMSKEIDSVIYAHKEKFIDNPDASGDELYAMISSGNYITKPAGIKLKLPSFNLPYYEGLNRYHDKSWLGIYRREELFSIDFLKEVCRLCLQTKVGQLCSTPWKTIIIKGIEEKDRVHWNDLLAKYQVNVRHAANELNFQVEDNCREGLALKNYLVKYLSREDVRTFGICFGIKMTGKSEVFSSVLIRRQPLFRIGKWGFIHFYDVLCAKDFNPNERTGNVFSRYNSKAMLPEQIRRVILSFYAHQAKALVKPGNINRIKEPVTKVEKKEYSHQCKHCQSVYDENTGDPDNGIAPGISFEKLPVEYCCSLCEAPAADFIKIEKSSLGLQAV
jgi:rubredoxin